MQVSVRTFLIAIIALIAPTAAFADIVQLNGVAQTTTYSGSTSALSQFDTTAGLPAPFLPAMATAFDDFTLGTTTRIDQLRWTGAYNGAAGLHASGFRISFYQNNAGAVGAQIGSTIIAPIASLAETANGGNHFSYTYTPLPGSQPLFTINSGATRFWMSVVASLDYGNDGLASPTENSWGWAFNSGSPANNNTSYQTTQTNPTLSGGFLTYDTFNDPVDYSFRLNTTAVPEPSSCLLLAGAIGGIAARKWRNRRKSAA